jgi:uncharacterized protein (TIGR03437 family)
MLRCSFRLYSIVFLAGAAVSNLGAQPSVAAVENAASNIDPRMPNAGIAQGAIFVIYGSGMGPGSAVVAPVPFQSTTLGNTSVSVTVGGATVNAPLYYASANQVAALLPSSTPTGTGTITVTYNGQTSAKAPITVVANNLALFTVDSTGTGPAIVTYPDYSLVSPFKAANCGGPNTNCGAANPGDVLILWATGLGPVTGNDVSGAGLGQNMPSIPLTVWVGGVQAQVTYQGRSGCCVGEDQIVFTVPSNSPTGCAVPLVVQINNEVSNSTAMPVAAKGSRTCQDTSAPGLDVSQLSSATSFSIGDVELDHLSNNNGSSFVDSAQGFFVRIAGLPALAQAFLPTYLDNQPAGTCTVIGANAPGDVFFNNLVTAGYVSLIDGGPSFTVTGPKGSMNVPITGNASVLSASGAFLVPGDYTITGAGGKDVGPFTAHITIPITPTLTSPASSNGVTITRSKGFTATWNPNGSTGKVEVVISSFVSQNTGAQAVCSAPASAGTLTIPPYVLLALPAGNANLSFQPGDESPAFAANFTATGITVGNAQAFIDGVGFGVTLN